MDKHRYHLTEYGWLTGLELNGTLEDEAFRAKCIGLIKYFKAQVAGRHETSEALVSHHALPAELPFGFVLNVLKSDLLQHMFLDKRINARWDYGKKIIRVPITFGMPND